MAIPRQNKESKNIVRKTSIKTLEDLINLNLSTLEDVINEDIDNKKAALIFTGSRTVTSSLKLGLESMKLGIRNISGISVGNKISLVDHDGPDPHTP